MAARPAHRREMPSKLLAFALFVTIPLLNGVMAQEENVTVAPSPQTGADARMIRGDMISITDAPDGDQGQIIGFPTLNTPVPTEKTTAGVTENTENEEITEKPAVNPETPGNLPPRGDSPNNKPKPQEDIICVSKEAVEGKNAVSLKLKELSNCKDTQMKIVSVLQELCGEDCKMEIYQEDNTDEVLVSGKYVEDDVPGMTNKFNNDNIKDKTNVDEAVPRWGKKSKLVLVSLLLAGLLLAALLVAGYCLKTHRKTSKGVRLAESFQVDEENQANTLVSVAPLPQEPLDKPIVNGESPPENGTNPAPTTNGHSATQTPVADTEM